MTAQKWLDELERLRKAATPGPWSKSEQGTNETYHHRIERYYGGKEVPEHIAYVFLPNVFGKLHDAAYIVAACNAVPTSKPPTRRITSPPFPICPPSASKPPTRRITRAS